MPSLPTDGPISVVPDWICEVLSPSTRDYDLVTKRRFYSRIGVPWLWYVDVEAESVTVSELVDGSWVERAVHGGDELVRLPPFTEVEFALSEWWASS